MSPQSFSNWQTGKTSSWPWPQRFLTSLRVMYVGTRAANRRDGGGHLLRIVQVGARQAECLQ